jgi:hypothetical protein
MWYNRFMLLAPDPDERQKSAEARSKFEQVGPPTLSKITHYLEAASTCQHDLERKGLWQVIPERRAEFLRVMQLMQKCAFTVSVALQNNRAKMAQDRPSAVWGDRWGRTEQCQLAVGSGERGTRKHPERVQAFRLDSQNQRPQDRLLTYGHRTPTRAAKILDRRVL